MQTARKATPPPIWEKNDDTRAGVQSLLLLPLTGSPEPGRTIRNPPLGGGRFVVDYKTLDLSGLGLQGLH